MALKSPLEAIFGNKTTAIIMLQLYHYKEMSPGVLAARLGKVKRPFQLQFENLEDARILVSRKIGNLRLYTFNPESPYIKHIIPLIKEAYDHLTQKDRDLMFATRTRPRKAGKEIINKR